MFESKAVRQGYTRYFLPNVEIKGYDWWKKPVKNDLRTYNNTQRIITGQKDACTADCLLDYSYFKDYCKTIMIDLSKQQALDADQKAIQQIIIEGAKQNILDFPKKTVQELWICFTLTYY